MCLTIIDSAEGGCFEIDELPNQSLEDKGKLTERVVILNHPPSKWNITKKVAPLSWGVVLTILEVNLSSKNITSWNELWFFQHLAKANHQNKIHKRMTRPFASQTYLRLWTTLNSCKFSSKARLCRPNMYVYIEHKIVYNNSSFLLTTIFVYV